ncbi:MAG: hypothetical protein R3F54_15605 [Alphaproteobacteria bacterium]
MKSSVERLWPAVDTDRSGQGDRIPPWQSDRQDKTDLQAALEELELSLQKANRRINRLQGERKQLEALLDKRDDQIQRLNRELGRHLPAQTLPSEGAARIIGGRASFISVLQSIAHGVGSWLARRQSKTEGAATKVQISDLTHGQVPPLAARRGGDVGQPIVGVVLFGLDKEKIEQLLPIIERDCCSRGMKPLCLVDLDAFELLRAHGLIFEYLPPMEERDRFDRSLHWDLYIQRRLAIIRRKWNPVRVVAFGESAMRMLTLWSLSPFEDKPLPTVLTE